MLWNLRRNISDSQKFQTDWSVNSVSLGIFTRGTSGGSGGIYVVICKKVLVKDQCHTLHNLWGIFRGRLGKQCGTFWGNLWESLRILPTLLWKYFENFFSQGIIQITVIVQVMKFPGILEDFQEAFREYLRHITEFLNRTTSFSNCGLTPTNGCKSNSGAFYFWGCKSTLF